jgi:hypothetical protein
MLKFYTLVDVVTVCPDYVRLLLTWLGVSTQQYSLRFVRFAMVLKLARSVDERE